MDTVVTKITRFDLIAAIRAASRIIIFYVDTSFRGKINSTLIFGANRFGEKRHEADL